MRKIMRLILVTLLVAMMSFSPATAYHYCDGYRGGGYYYTHGSGYAGCQPAYYDSGCCDTTDYESSECSTCDDCETIVSSACDNCGGGCETSQGDCGCEGEAYAPDDEVVIEEVPMAAPAPPTYLPPSTPSTVNRMPSEPAPALPPGPLPIPETEQRILPAAPIEREPVAKEPAPMPTEMLTPPAPETDDLFGEPMSVPSDEPAAEPATPAADATDDLFGEPAREEPPLPVEEPATPAEAATDADDLFGEPAATEPAEEATPSAPADESGSKPLDDDLFGPPAEEAPAEEVPAEDAAPAEEGSDDFDDLFGSSEQILELPGGLASSELRQWVDDTGSFSCRGRMIRMLDGKVQLLKDTGRTTTVPLSRLSQADLEFVNRQASAQKTETFGKTAQATNAWSN